MDQALKGKKLGFIGSGIMAEAIVSGVLKKQLLPSTSICCADPYPARLEQLEKRYSVKTTVDNKQAIEGADVVFLSVKPQVLSEVSHSILGAFAPEQLVISILAGVDTRTLTKHLGHQSVVRTMPNTPARVGEGMTVWTATPDVSKEQRTMAQTLLGALGEEVFVSREGELDMATALSGTGPAYVFLFMESLIDAGVHLGFSRRVAEKLVLQTVKGSVDFALQSDAHLAELRNQVTSPGGTTADALYQMEKGGLRTVLSKAVFSAFQKSRALSNVDGD
ncbi:MAG: pyrroline-5-carboxylate reductase [Vulcanimicrobiota bacterium]